MSMESERERIICGTCGAHVNELRRGRCWACYMKWSELRPVGRGAICVVCHERRRDNLRMVEIHNRSMCLCHMCGTRALKLTPVPHSVEGLRAALRRDRRGGARRDEGRDGRIFPRERRVGDRRGPPRELVFGDTDPAVMLNPPLPSVEVQLDEDDIDVIELTVVRAAPAVGIRDL